LFCIVHSLSAASTAVVVAAAAVPSAAGAPAGAVELQELETNTMDPTTINSPRGLFI
jgi:hypothetical protein